MRKAMIAGASALVFAGAVLVSVPASAQPSRACANGELPPAESPVGIGAAVVGEPGAGPASLFVCNDGSTVPPPAKGSVRVTVDPDDPHALIVVDGDNDNAPPACTRGFIGVKVDAAGPHLHGEPTGDYSSGARDRIPEGIAFDLVDCAEGEAGEVPELPLPPLPDVPEP